jgi:TonB-dependent starch-binding outer membrane protein SusC
MNLEKLHLPNWKNWKVTLLLLALLLQGTNSIQAAVKNNFTEKNPLKTKIRQKQNTVITGVVTTENSNETLPGVNVVVKGTKQNTVTDFDGKYSIVVNDTDAVMVFSSIGFAEKEVRVGSQKVLNVKLTPSTNKLDEVVVVGYGSVKRSKVLGAVSSVSLKEANSRTYNSTAELLQGTVSGVTVINNGGDPTAAPTINIRGIGSLNGEAPLLVLDGVVYNGSFNNINASDIESISVLKDAAAAIYGARASGGVILVTTKRGSANKTRLNVEYQSGLQQVAKKLVALTANEYADAINLATDNAGKPRITEFATTNLAARTTNTDWMKEIFRIGEVKNLAVSLEGGSEKANFFLSGGYRRNEGILLNTYFERYTGRINSSFKLTPSLTVGESLNYSLTNGQSGKTSDAYTGAILTALLYTPSATVYRQDGSGLYGGTPERNPSAYGDLINPVAYLNRLDVKNPISNILINPYAEWKITKSLTFRSNWSYNYTQNNLKQFVTKVPEIGKPNSSNQLIQTSNTATDLLSEQTLSFDKKFGSNHELRALFSYNFQQIKSEYYGFEASGFDNEDPSQRYLINAKTILSRGGGAAEDNLLSYVGRLNYSYKDKYLLTGIIRRDGTSRLSAANRWEVYPSVSLGWIVTEESFMKSLVPVLSNLKFRASWGEIGNLRGAPVNQSISLSQTTSIFGQNPITSFGFAENQISNPSLKWERSEQRNIGVDFGFFNNSFSGTVDVFVKRNRNMLFREILQGASGSSGGRIVNAGTTENRGVELGLNYKNKIGEVKVDFALNFAVLNNKIESLNKGIDSFEPENATRIRSLPISNINKIGEAVGAFYGIETDGIFQTDKEVIDYAKITTKTIVNSNGVTETITISTPIQPKAKAGDFKFKDTNNDGTIDEKDRVILGRPFPKNTFSFNTNLNYKGFDLNIFLQGVSGNSVFNAVRFSSTNANLPGYNLLAEVKNAWTPENPNATIPKLSTADENNNFGRITSFYIEDASFLRLRNVTLGYTIKEKWLNNKAKLRFYFSAQNLFTITKYSGMDPEVGLTNFGIDVGSYPLSRIYMTGVNVSF